MRAMLISQNVFSFFCDLALFQSAMALFQLYQPFSQEQRQQQQQQHWRSPSLQSVSPGSQMMHASSNLHVVNLANGKRILHLLISLYSYIYYV